MRFTRFDLFTPAPVRQPQQRLRCVVVEHDIWPCLCVYVCACVYSMHAPTHRRTHAESGICICEPEISTKHLNCAYGPKIIRTHSRGIRRFVRVRSRTHVSKHNSSITHEHLSKSVTSRGCCGNIGGGGGDNNDDNDNNGRHTHTHEMTPSRRCRFERVARRRRRFIHCAISGWVYRKRDELIPFIRHITLHK